MHKLALAASVLCIPALFPALSLAQTVGAQAIRRDVFTDRPFPGEAARGVVEVPPRATVVEVPQRVVEDGIVRRPVAPVVERTIVERPVVRERTVVERPVVRERVVVAEPVVEWWDLFVRNRYGYFDDAYFDDNWFYDYYEVPRVTRGVGTPGFRTGWIYDPIAERGLFNF